MVPVGCRLRVADDTRPWQEGKCLIFDDTVEHEAWNDSDQMRGTLLLDFLRPGITDYASLRFRNEGEILKGSSDPDREYMEKIHPEKMRLGLEYVRTRSFLTDIEVILQTFFAVFGR